MGSHRKFAKLRQLVETESLMKEQASSWESQKSAMQQEHRSKEKQAEEERNDLLEKIAALEFEVPGALRSF